MMRSQLVAKLTIPEFSKWMIQRLPTACCPRAIRAKRLGNWIGVKQKKTVS